MGQTSRITAFVPIYLTRWINGPKPLRSGDLLNRIAGHFKYSAKEVVVPVEAYPDRIAPVGVFVL